MYLACIAVLECLLVSGACMGQKVGPEPCPGAPCRQRTLMAHAMLQAVVRMMLERVWERGDIYKAN